MKTVEVTCDVCGRVTKRSKSLRVVEQGICGRTDPVKSTTVDLCPKCLHREMQFVLEHLVELGNYKKWAARMLEFQRAHREQMETNRL